MLMCEVVVNVVRAAPAERRVGKGRGGGREQEEEETPYLSGTSDFVPTRSVFRGRCHCCLICAR